MNKKEYKRPSAKEVKLDTAISILAGSEPSQMSVFDVPVEEHGDEGDALEGWGTQW